jgi:hypothetical protein
MGAKYAKHKLFKAFRPDSDPHHERSGLQDFSRFQSFFNLFGDGLGTDWGRRRPGGELTLRLR